MRVVGERLGVGIANLVNIFNPEVVVIGGGVIAAGELLLGPARDVMMRRALSPAKDMVRVVGDLVRRRVGDDRRGAAGGRPEAAEWGSGPGGPAPAVASPGAPEARS